MVQAVYEKVRKYGRDALLTESNLLSGSRIVLSLDLVKRIASQKKHSMKTLLEHLGVSLTDFFDGEKARRDGTTKLGEFLDPLADSIQVLSELSVLAIKDEIPMVPVAIIAAREAFIKTYRAGVNGDGVDLPSRRLGKVKTFSQLTTIGLALLPEFKRKRGVVNVALWTSAALTVISGIDVVTHGRRTQRELKKS